MTHRPVFVLRVRAEPDVDANPNEEESRAVAPRKKWGDDLDDEIPFNWGARARVAAQHAALSPPSRFPVGGGGRVEWRKLKDRRQDRRQDRR